MAYLRNHRKWYLGALVLLLLPGFVLPLQGQTEDASRANLERRVQELEEVRQLMAERNTQPKPAAEGGPPVPVAVPLDGTTAADSQEAGAEDAKQTEGAVEESQAPSGQRPLPGPTPGTGATIAPPRAPAGATAPAGWNNGFFLQSNDKLYRLRFTGQIQGDYRAFLDGVDTTDVDSFLVRRARLGVEADLLQSFEFRLMPDFSNGQSPGVLATPRILDAYMNVHYWDSFQFESGKFKQPFSYEQLIQDRFVPTLERSLIDQLVPAREPGVMLWGAKLFDNRLDWYISCFNGDANNDYDMNDRKDVVARVVIRPFGSPSSPEFLRYFQIGNCVTTGIEQDTPVIPAVLRTPSTVPWFRFNPTVRGVGLRNRMSPELAYFYGPLGLAAQYFWEEQEMQPTTVGPASFDRVPVHFQGYYVLATLLLTGEKRTGFTWLEPLRPFDPHCPCHSPGAWELVARVSRLHVSQNVFDPGLDQLANPTLFANDCTEMTLGINWYLNKWVRMQLNWEHDWFNQGVRLGPLAVPAGLFRHQDALLTRFQFVF